MNQVKKDMGGHWWWIIACIIPVILIGAVVGIAATQSGNNEFEGLKVKSDKTYANVITVYTDESAPVVTVYEDPLCPYCRRLEDNSSSQLLDKVKKGEIQLEYKIVNILDKASDTGDYSSRVLGAYISILKNEKNPEVFNAFHKWVYDNQPQEGTSLDQGTLIKGMAESGAAEVTTNWYKETNNWIGDIPSSVSASTKQIQEVRNGQVGVPTVVFDEKLVNTENSNWVKELK